MSIFLFPFLFPQGNLIIVILPEEQSMDYRTGIILKVERITYAIVTIQLDTEAIHRYRCFSGVVTPGDTIEFNPSPGTLWDEWTGVGTMIIEPQHIIEPPPHISYP